MLESPIRSNTARLELRERVWQNLLTDFRSDRLIPNFFDRLLGAEAGRFIAVFQTVEAWELTADFSPSVLYAEASDGRLVDKLCLRDLAVELGVEPDLVWAAKDPLQFSAGIIGAFERSGRELVAADPATRTYTDPLDERAEVVIARMWLRHILAEQARSDGSTGDLNSAAP